MDQPTPPKPGPSGNLETIRDLLTRPDPASRIMGARACLTVKNRELLPALLGALEKERELQIIVLLVQVLGGYRDPRATTQLHQALHHSAARTRANTADSPMSLDDPVVFDAVSLLATDAASRVRASVALMLAARDPAKTEGIARELLESDLLCMRECAVNVLQVAGAPWCVPLLQALSNRPGEDPALIERASAALQHLRQRSGPVAPAAREATANPAPAQRAPPAAPTPGPTAAPSAEERAALFRAVNDSSAIVRLEALEKLATLDDKEAEERVGMAAMDVDSRVRGRAEALAPEIELRRAARQLLAKLGTTALRAGPLPSECIEASERATALGAQLDRGPRTPELVLARESALAELGRTVLEASSAGAELSEALTAACAQTQTAITSARQTARIANEQAAASVKDKTTKGDQAVAARATRQVRALSAPTPGKLTGRVQAQKPREPWAILVLLSRRAVLYPLLFVLAVAGMVLHSELKLAEQAKMLAVPQNVQPRDIGAAEYPRMFMGAPIRWEGTIVESSPDKLHLVVVSDGVRYPVEFEKALDKRYDTGITVIIVGKIYSVTGGLTVRGKQVELPVRKP